MTSPEDVLTKRTLIIYHCATRSAVVDKLKELTKSDIEEIRKLHNAGKRHSRIAHKYRLRKKELSEILFTEVR